QSAGPGGQASLIVREVTEKDIADAAKRAGGVVKQESLAVLALEARDGRYLVRRTDDAYPLMVPLQEGYNVGTAWLAVQRLEHMAR
ncbi:hypothetical protein, partial [Escherichia coli]|uniref:hypothetical protein n=1 Tax=Escherichia coli TaxID=562 RepID=UPI001AA1C080